MKESVRADFVLNDGFRILRYNRITNLNEEVNMNYKRISNEEFLAKKAEALQNEPQTKTVRLDQIELSERSFDDGVVKVVGKNMAASPEFFNKLSGILNISDAMKRDLTGDDARKKAGLFPKMVETMKLIKGSKNGGGSVTIIGNPKTGELTSVTDRAYNRIPNEQLFKVAETLVERYPVLSPIEIDVRDGGMGVGISLLSDAEHPFKPMRPSAGGGAPEDETFKFGFTLNNGTITSLGDFAYRLVCSNGMMGMRKAENFQLKDLSNDSIRKMFEHISEAEKRRFMPMMFAQNMENAGTTNASYRELEKLYGSVVGNLSTEDDELKKHFKREIAHRFFQGYIRTTARLAQKEVDVRNLSDKQKAFISTGQRMWDVINNITWLGSNNSGYDWKNQQLLQKLGGKVFSEEHDLQYASLMNV